MAEIDESKKERLKKTMGQITLDGLLIEKDPMLAGIIEEQLQQYKVVIHKASSVEEIFIVVEGTKLDAVLIDLDHPDIDVIQLIATIRKSSSNKKAPIIVMASLDDISKVEKASAAGASHFLPKPLVWSQMHELMEKLRWRMIDERRHYRRATALMPVLCTLEGRKVIGQSMNISSKGILLQLEDQLEVGTELTAAFPYSTQYAASFMFRARVARHVKGKDGVIWTGIEFTDISEEETDKLVMWVDLFTYFNEGVVGS